MNKEESIDYLEFLEKKLAKLKEDEKILSNKNLKEKNEDIKKKLSSNNPSNFLPILAEIDIAYELSLLFNKDEWFYEQGSKKARKPDFRISHQGKELDLELIKLMQGRTMEKVESVFNSVASEYLNEVKTCLGNFILLITLDTRKLISDTEGINIEKSTIHLISSLKKLDLVNLLELGIDINLDIQEITRLKSSNQSANKDLVLHIIDATGTDQQVREKLRMWLDNISENEINQSPFHAISIKTQIEGKCIFVHPLDESFSDDKDPESLENISKESYLKQIGRAICKKYRKHQRKVGNPAIILIETFNVHFNIFDNSQLLSLLELEKYVKTVLENFSDISGVLLYANMIYDGVERFLYDGKYIQNDYADKDIALSESDLQDIHIIRKPNETLLINDLLLSKDDSIEIQENKIIRLLELQPILEAKNDIIRLLQNILFFLNNESINDDILKRLEDVIIEYCFHNDPQGDSPFDSDDCNGFMYTQLGIRNLAARSLLRILSFDNLENLENKKSMIKLLANDANTLVREAITQDLHYLYEVDRLTAIDLAKRYIHDNGRIRCVLVKFLEYLSDHNTPDCLPLIIKILNDGTYRIYYLQNTSDPLISEAVGIIVDESMDKDNISYTEYLDALINDVTIPSKIKTVFLDKMSDGKYLTNPKLRNKLYDKISRIVQSSEDPDNQALMNLLRSLKNNNISFLPEVLPLLQKISKLRFHNPSYNDFRLLEYIEAFWKEMPDCASKLIKNMVRNNQIEQLHYYFHRFLKIAVEMTNSSKLSSNSIQELQMVIQEFIEYNPEIRNAYREQLDFLSLIRFMYFDL